MANEPVLEVKNLHKKYPTFELKDVSFAVIPGKITGFIGRNGAGKTTTLKCIYNLVKPTSGSILFQGKETVSIEAEFKENVGIMFGETNFYPSKTVKSLSSVTKSFYKNWNESLYQQYLKDFGIDENKQIKSLSSGMKVKYGLALALSRGAKVLLLDEPTSGLDPVSRDELLDIFLNLVSDGEHAILFSTHVISDLEKCADDIVYIKGGKIIKNQDVTSFEASYLHYSGESEDFKGKKELFVFYRDRLGKFEGIAEKEKERDIGTAKGEKRKATMEEIMIAFERGNAE